MRQAIKNLQQLTAGQMVLTPVTINGKKMWVNRDTNGYSHLVGEHWDGSITLFMVTSKGQIIEDTKSVLVTGRGGTWNEFEEE